MLRTIGIILLVVGIILLITAIVFGFTVGTVAVPVFFALSVLLNTLGITLMRTKKNNS